MPTSRHGSYVLLPVSCLRIRHNHNGMPLDTCGLRSSLIPRTIGIGVSRGATPCDEPRSRIPFQRTGISPRRCTVWARFSLCAGRLATGAQGAPFRGTTTAGPDAHHGRRGHTNSWKAFAPPARCLGAAEGSPESRVSDDRLKVVERLRNRDCRDARRRTYSTGGRG